MHPMFPLSGHVLLHLFLSWVFSLTPLSGATLGSIVPFLEALNLFDSSLCSGLLVMGMSSMNGFYPSVLYFKP